MKYQPHIDGLRAIAISFVLLFHAGLQFIPSGYIGVDIFFVISGFLITRIIHDSLDKNKFSFIYFYGRRLWRLQPALLAMLFLTTLLTYIFFLPEDLIFYGQSAKRTLTFISNQYFSKATAGYFAQESNQLPLLHTWSLSVEWQCYLILPFIIYIAHYFTKDRYFRKIIYGLTLLSICWSLYLSEYSTSTYYQFSSRFFEFLMGASIAVYQQRFSINRYFLEILSGLALLLLLYLALIPGIENNFPNGYAILLCVVTGVLIFIGEQPYQSICIRLLSAKPMVLIGLISYSLYLWHWPLFAVLHYLDVQSTPMMLILIFASLLSVSYLSWRYIEKPARQLSSMHLAHTCIYLLIIPLVVLQTSHFVTKKYHGFPQRFPQAEYYMAQLKKYESIQRESCLVFKSGAVNDNCTFGSTQKNSKKGFLIGDSFSNHYWRFLEVFAKKSNISVLANATGSCLALPGIHRYFLSKIHQECFNQTQRYYEMIKNNHYNYVFIGESWQGYMDDSVVIHPNDIRSPELNKLRIEKALDKALAIITHSGATPIIIKDIALTSDRDPYSCFIQQTKHRKNYSKDCDYPIDVSLQQWRNLLFDKMKQKYPRLIVMDPQKLLCTKSSCTADINKVPVFRDKAHLTDYASYQLARRYIERYNNPFNSKNA